MNITYVPKACKGENKLFEGSVCVALPTFDQKYEYMEKCNFDLNDKADMTATTSQISSIRKMVNFSKAHYKEVNLKRKSDGKEFKSFNDMSYDSDCDAILIEVASNLLSGFKVGKN